MSELCTDCIHSQVCFYRKRLMQFDFGLRKMDMNENPISYNCDLYLTYDEILESEKKKEIGFK